jgi:hypothetical protein
MRPVALSLERIPHFSVPGRDLALDKEVLSVLLATMFLKLTSSSMCRNGAVLGSKKLPNE